MPDAGNAAPLPKNARAFTYGVLVPRVPRNRRSLACVGEGGVWENTIVCLEKIIIPVRGICYPSSNVVDRRQLALLAPGVSQASSPVSK